MSRSMTSVHGGPTFNYSVNDEPQATQEHVLTARTILSNAGFDPTQYYLVEIEGDHQESHKDRPDDEIHMHERMKFLALFIGPTGVS